MRTRFYKNFLFILPAFIYASCAKEHPNYSSGKATAEKNGRQWTGEARLIDKFEDGKTIFIEFNVYNKNDELRETLYFTYVPRKIGEHPLQNCGFNDCDSLTARYYILAADGDVLDDAYRKTDPSSKFVITHSSTNVISGNFDLIMTMDDPSKKFNPNNPDTIRFKNGSFKVKLDR